MSEPKEYIINEEMVQCIEAWTQRFPIVSKDIVDVIRSRPHPASEPALPTTINAANWTHEEVMNRLQCTYDRGYNAGFIEGQKDGADNEKLKATEDLKTVLGELQAEAASWLNRHPDDGERCIIGSFCSKIESLRQQTGVGK